MEHIVQFAIGIDDKAIQDRIEKEAYNDIINKLIEDVKNDLPKQNGFRDRSVNWRYLVEQELTEFVEKNRAEIIDAAANKLCESFKRTKVFKEAMTDAMNK